MKKSFESWNPGQDTLDVIVAASAICREYAAQGYELTLRQLYYQFVARGFLENHQKSYNRLGSIVNKARMAGLLDWDYIVDRTRNLRRLATWESPNDILKIAAEQYKTDPWRFQKNYVEVWIEKDALVGVIERICNEWRVPHFSCRGYTSQSEMYEAGNRLRKIAANGGAWIHILHLGDHDPSGIDMSRDIEERLSMFSGCYIHFKRLALNMAQIRQYQPPPNPAKSTDSRYDTYTAAHGEESWELDALTPQTIDELVTKEIVQLVNMDEWEDELLQETEQREKLLNLAAEWKA